MSPPDSTAAPTLPTELIVDRRREPRGPLPGAGRDAVHAVRSGSGRPAPPSPAAAHATALWRPDSPRETDVLAQVLGLLLAAGSKRNHLARTRRR